MVRFDNRVVLVTGGSAGLGLGIADAFLREGAQVAISGLSFHSPHYSASKGGMVAFTRSVGLEVIGAGINVNCIAAGDVATDSWEQILNIPGGEQMHRQLLQMIPAGRMGTIHEYASLALYLASDDAGYMVGQIISPNGGMVT